MKTWNIRFRSINKEKGRGSERINPEYNKIREENEELKSRVDMLENKYQRHSTADPMPDRNGEHMIRSRSPAPTYSERNELMSRKISVNVRNNDMPNFNNASGPLSTQYYDNYASPATKSAISDRSWIDKNEVFQNSSTEQAQVQIEKMGKIIGHLQNEYAKNLLVIDQLMEENRRLNQKNDSSYYRDFN